MGKAKPLGIAKHVNHKISLCFIKKTWERSRERWEAEGCRLQGGGAGMSWIRGGNGDWEGTDLRDIL